MTRDRRRLVSNPLRKVPDGALDAPGKNSSGARIEHCTDLRGFLRREELLIVNLGRNEGKMIGHLRQW